MSKKNKFNLADLVHEGFLTENESLIFVSDPSKIGQIFKHPGGEYKIRFEKAELTLHAFAQKCLGEEPPDHASRWFKTQKGMSIYDLWQRYLEVKKAS